MTYVWQIGHGHTTETTGAWNRAPYPEPRPETAPEAVLVASSYLAKAAFANDLEQVKVFNLQRRLGLMRVRPAGGEQLGVSYGY